MIDQYLIPSIRTALSPLAKWANARGITANQVTLTGFALGLLAVPCIAMGAYGWGLVFIAINRILDGLDGVLARETEPTDQGAFLDITLDFFFYALIPLSFAIAEPSNALPAAFLLASFIGTGTSFLAFSLLAERRKMQSIQYPNKGIYYLGGLTEGFETIAFFIFVCLFPNLFPISAYVFAAACFLTAGLRTYYGYKTFKHKKD